MKCFVDFHDLSTEIYNVLAQYRCAFIDNEPDFKDEHELGTRTCLILFVNDEARDATLRTLRYPPESAPGDLLHAARLAHRLSGWAQTPRPRREKREFFCSVVFLGVFSTPIQPCSQLIILSYMYSIL